MKLEYETTRKRLRYQSVISVTAGIAVSVVSLVIIFFLPLRDFLWYHALLRNDSAIAAENQYSVMEENLRMHLEYYETLHQEYDAYRYELDEIGHDPSVLLSILLAKHGESFSFAEVQSTLKWLFEQQYIITEEISVKIKYVSGEETDYNTCTVRLENRDLAGLSPLILDGEQYAVYTDTLKRMERSVKE